MHGSVQQRVIKSDLTAKVREAERVLREKGLVGLYLAVKEYLIYHLIGKWSFVYLEFMLDQPIVSFVVRDSISVRIATPEDQDRIESDIFPLLEGPLAYEKKYFQLLGHPDARCFLAESDRKLVHYSWVFVDAFQSPITEVPFDQGKLRTGDAYVGPIFTHPAHRGFIFLQVLSAILHYLKEAGCRRTIVLVQGRNPAAVSFYKRMGFREIADAQPRNIFAYLGKRAKSLSREGYKQIIKRFASSKERSA